MGVLRRVKIEKKIRDFFVGFFRYFRVKRRMKGIVVQ
jgi:hypothetical protein